MWLLWIGTFTCLRTTAGTFTRCAADKEKPHPISQVGLVLSEEEVKEEEDSYRAHDRLPYRIPVV